MTIVASLDTNLFSIETFCCSLWDFILLLPNYNIGVKMGGRARSQAEKGDTKRESVSHSLRYEVSKWSLQDFEVIGSYHKLLDDI